MTWLQLTIVALRQLIATYKLQGVPLEMISNLESALANLMGAHLQELTFGNVESLRVEIPDWTGSDVKSGS